MYIFVQEQTKVYISYEEIYCVIDDHTSMYGVW